jgi:hypothetical protein
MRRSIRRGQLGAETSGGAAERGVERYNAAETVDSSAVRAPAFHDAQAEVAGHCEGGDEAEGAGATRGCGRPRHGEELGTETASLGDDPKKGGENVWISRIAIDLA